MKYLVLALLIVATTTFAGEKIDSFDGLEATKEGDCIVIDYTPTADRKKMARDDDINQIKTQRLRSKQRAEQSIRDMEKAK